MKGKKSIKLLTFIMSAILLVSLFGTAGTAFADEDSNTLYYDKYGNELTDPCNADACFSSDNTSVPCPECATSKEKNSKDEKSVPPGQMVRNGLIGPVVNITSSYFLVKTNFGIVQVCINQTINASIGQRIAVKLGKIESGASEYAHNGTDNGTTSQFGNIYRVVTALQFRLIPSKGMKHKWGSLEPSGQGCVFVDEEGNQISAECGNSSGNVIGLVGGSGNGTGGNVTALLLQTQQMSKILSRIKQRLTQANAEGDEKTCEWLKHQLTKLEEKQLRLEEKMIERAAVRAEKTQKKGQK